jgi:hypothetical protein
LHSDMKVPVVPQFESFDAKGVRRQKRDMPAKPPKTSAELLMWNSRLTQAGTVSSEIEEPISTW